MCKGISSLLTNLILCSVLISGCQNLPWPDSPLYQPPVNDPDWTPPATVLEAKEALQGHYGHYDIVAYDGETPSGPMRTFIISYGFTDFVLEGGGDLIEYDRFCHAEHKANSNMESSFDDAATQAIVPRDTAVEVFEENGEWKIWRPATPTLLGIDGDPDQPLSMDPDDPRIIDADGDGKPGVTVDIRLGGFIEAEIYIARREIFQSDLTLYSDGSLHGHVVDESEQLVIGATLDFLAVPNNPPQAQDYGLSPMRLIPISEDLDTCDQLMANRDALFPLEPEFSK